MADLHFSAAHTPAEQTLDHAIVYLHGVAQHARTREEHEDFTITLKLLALLRDGWQPGQAFSMLPVATQWASPMPSICIAGPRALPLSAGNCLVPFPTSTIRLWSCRTEIRQTEGGTMETTFVGEIGTATWLVRQARKMSQSQLAVRMKTTRQQVSDLEIGQLPSVATLFRIARALRIHPACLVLIAENRQRELARRLSAPRCGSHRPVKKAKDCSTSGLSSLGVAHLRPWMPWPV